MQDIQNINAQNGKDVKAFQSISYAEAALNYMIKYIKKYFFNLVQNIGPKCPRLSHMPKLLLIYMVKYIKR